MSAPELTLGPMEAGEPWANGSTPVPVLAPVLLGNVCERHEWWSQVALLQLIDWSLVFAYGLLLILAFSKMFYLCYHRNAKSSWFRFGTCACVAVTALSMGVYFVLQAAIDLPDSRSLIERDSFATWAYVNQLLPNACCMIFICLVDYSVFHQEPRRVALLGSPIFWTMSMALWCLTAFAQGGSQIIAQFRSQSWKLALAQWSLFALLLLFVLGSIVYALAKHKLSTTKIWAFKHGGILSLMLFRGIAYIVLYSLKRSDPDGGLLASSGADTVFIVHMFLSVLPLCSMVVIGNFPQSAAAKPAVVRPRRTNDHSMEAAPLLSTNGVDRVQVAEGGDEEEEDQVVHLPQVEEAMPCSAFKGQWRKLRRTWPQTGAVLSAISVAAALFFYGLVEACDSVGAFPLVFSRGGAMTLKWLAPTLIILIHPMANVVLRRFRLSSFLMLGVDHAALLHRVLAMIINVVSLIHSIGHIVTFARIQKGHYSWAVYGERALHNPSLYAIPLVTAIIMLLTLVMLGVTAIYHRFDVHFVLACIFALTFVFHGSAHLLGLPYGAIYMGVVLIVWVCGYIVTSYRGRKFGWTTNNWSVGPLSPKDRKAILRDPTGEDLRKDPDNPKPGPTYQLVVKGLDLDKRGQPRHQPGDFVKLQMWSIQWFGRHPFTIAEVEVDANQRKYNLVFYISAVGVFTRMLWTIGDQCRPGAELESSPLLKPSLSVSPYYLSPLSNAIDLMDVYSKFLIVGTGIGATAVGGLLQQMGQHGRNTAKSWPRHRRVHIRFIYASAEMNHLRVVVEALMRAMSNQNIFCLSAQIYNTSNVDGDEWTGLQANYPIEGVQYIRGSALFDHKTLLEGLVFADDSHWSDSTINVFGCSKSAVASLIYAMELLEISSSKYSFHTYLEEF